MFRAFSFCNCQSLFGHCVCFIFPFLSPLVFFLTRSCVLLSLLLFLPSLTFTLILVFGLLLAPQTPISRCVWPCTWRDTQVTHTYNADNIIFMSAVMTHNRLTPTHLWDANARGRKAQCERPAIQTCSRTDNSVFKVNFSFPFFFPSFWLPP